MLFFSPLRQLTDLGDDEFVVFPWSQLHGLANSLLWHSNPRSVRSGGRRTSRGEPCLQGHRRRRREGPRPHFHARRRARLHFVWADGLAEQLCQQDNLTTAQHSTASNRQIKSTLTMSVIIICSYRQVKYPRSSCRYALNVLSICTYRVEVVLNRQPIWLASVLPLQSNMERAATEFPMTQSASA